MQGLLVRAHRLHAAMTEVSKLEMSLNKDLMKTMQGLLVGAHGLYAAMTEGSKLEMTHMVAIGSVIHIGLCMVDPPQMQALGGW